MFDLERLSFSQVRDAYPDRYGKVNLAGARLESLDGPQFAVERSDSDEGHIVQLVYCMSHYWGSCSCDGYEYHEGPCSHLCGVKRADAKDLLDIPQAKPEAISVEIVDRQQELADHVEKQAATDGGY